MIDKNASVTVPALVHAQLELVRDSGKVNMLDRLGVQRVANTMKLYKLVIWIQDTSPGEWGPIIFNGTTPDRALTEAEEERLADLAPGDRGDS